MINSVCFGKQFQGTAEEAFKPFEAGNTPIIGKDLLQFAVRGSKKAAEDLSATEYNDLAEDRKKCAQICEDLSKNPQIYKALGAVMQLGIQSTYGN